MAEEHDLLVYSDEIYDRLVYGDHEHTAFSSLPGMRERTVLLGGFSKSYAMTGWRIGYVAAPAGLMEGIAKVHQYGIMCAPTPAQHAAIEALRNGEEAVRAMHAEYDRRRRLVTDRFNAIGLACFEPKGAFYCFPHVTDATGLDETAFAEALLAEEQVGVVPGHGVRAVRRRPRPRLLRDRVRADRGGHGPHRALRRPSADVTRTRFGSTAAFSSTAADYAATMAPALAPMAAEVVARAELRPGETVLDIGTGTGTAARLAEGDGRRVIGLDGAEGMLEIARAEAPGVEFILARLRRSARCADGSVDVILAVHALLFADDRVAALAEWRRLAAPGGRLSISVPGPDGAVPATVFSEVYDAYGIEWHADDYPEPSDLEDWARQAGWADPVATADESTAIRLADETAFRTWLRVARPTSDWSSERKDAYARDLMAACPRDADGAFRIPFGTLYPVGPSDRMSFADLLRVAPGHDARSRRDRSCLHARLRGRQGCRPAPPG